MSYENYGLGPSQYPPYEAALASVEEPEEPARRGLLDHNIGTLMLASGVSGAVLAAGAIVGIEQTVHHPESSQGTTAQACAAPSESAIAATETLLKNPRDPIVSQTVVDQGMQKRAATGRGVLTTREYRQAVYSGRQKVAARNGLHMHDPDPYLTPFEANVLEGNTDKYFTLAQKYFKEFGVELSPKAPKEALVQDGTAPAEAAALRGPNVRKTLKHTIEDFGQMPQEYIALSGLKHIYFADMPTHPAKLPLKGTMTTAAYALTGGRHDTIVFNVNAASDNHIPYHEIEHLVDSSECDGPTAAENDAAFTEHNGGLPYGQKSPTTLPDFDAQQRVPREQRDGLLLTGEAEDDKKATAIACRIETRIAQGGQEARFVTPYANTNEVEDKGEVGAALPDAAAWPGMLNPETPFIRAKFATLGARLYEAAPNVMKFFAAVGNRPIGRLAPANILKRCGLKF